MAEPARHLHLIDDDGQPAADAPSYGDALALLEQLETTITKLDNRHRGDLLKIARLEQDRERATLDSPLRPQVELVHALWKKACGKRRGMKFTDREQVEDAIRKLGLETCVRAVVGARYDSRGKRRRNGTYHYWNDLDDIFKTFKWVTEYSARAPASWTPDAGKIADLTKVDGDKVRGWLEAGPEDRKRTKGRK